MTYCNKEDRLQVEWLQQAIPLEEDAEDIQDVEVDWILGGWNGSWGESSQPACIPQGIDDSSLDSMEDIHLLKKRYQPRKFRRTTTNQQGRQVRKQYGNYSRQQSSWQAWNSQCLAVWCVPFWCARTSRVGDPLTGSIVRTTPNINGTCKSPNRWIHQHQVFEFCPCWQLCFPHRVIWGVELALNDEATGGTMIEVNHFSFLFWKRNQRIQVQIRSF